VDVGDAASEVLDGPVFVDEEAVAGEHAPGEEDVAPFGEALFGAEDDVEELVGVEALSAGVGGGDSDSLAWGWGCEEEADREGEPAGEGEEVIRGELADAASVD